MPMASKDDGTLILKWTGRCTTRKANTCPEEDGHSFAAKRFRLIFISDGKKTSRGFNLTYEIKPTGEDRELVTQETGQ
jgi:hypothetical protein